MEAEVDAIELKFMLLYGVFEAKLTSNLGKYLSNGEAVTIPAKELKNQMDEFKELVIEINTMHLQTEEEKQLVKTRLEKILPEFFPRVQPKKSY
jgi:hypothetical protein